MAQQHLWKNKTKKKRHKSVGKSNTSPLKQIFYIATSGTAFLILSLILLYWLLIYTTLPVKIFLNSQNVNISYEGLSGSLSEGFSVKNLVLKKNDKVHILKNLYILLNKNEKGLKKILPDNKYELSLLRLQSIKIKLTSDLSLNTKPAFKFMLGNLFPFAGDGKGSFISDKITTGRTYVVKKALIKSMQVSTSKEHLNYHNIFVSNLSVSPVELQVQKAHYDINGFEVKFVNLKRNDLGYKYAVSGRLKKNNSFFKNLKKDIKFKFIREKRLGVDLDSYMFSAFNKKARISISKQNKKLMFKNLKLDTYFKSKSPIKKIFLSANNKFLTGKVKLRNQYILFPKQKSSVLFQKSILQGIDKTNKHLFIFSLNRLLQNKPWFMSVKQGELHELNPSDLGSVYFSKNLALQRKYQKVLKNDAQYFLKSPFGVKKNSESKSLRAPSNHKSK